MGEKDKVTGHCKLNKNVHRIQNTSEQQLKTSQKLRSHPKSNIFGNQETKLQN